MWVGPWSDRDKKEGIDGKEWASPDGMDQQRTEGLGLRPGRNGRLPGSCLFRVARQCCPLFSYALNFQKLPIVKGQKEVNAWQSLN
jgi:hypothetical protein